MVDGHIRKRVPFPWWDKTDQGQNIFYDNRTGRVRAGERKVNRRLKKEGGGEEGKRGKENNEKSGERKERRGKEWREKNGVHVFVRKSHALTGRPRPTKAKPGELNSIPFATARMTRFFHFLCSLTGSFFAG